jgi:O-antigen/teichoic acid export membrane protein
MMLGVLVTGPLMLIWTTYIFEIAKRPQAPAIYARALTYYALAAVAFALPLCLFGRELLALVATPHYLAAYRVIPLVALGFGFLGCASVMEVGIYLRRRTGVRLGNMATAAAANLGLNWLLVPRLGGRGAAWAAMGALGLLAVLTYVTCRRLYPVPYELGRLARLAAVTAGAWLAYSQGAVALPGGAQVAAKLAILAAVPVALYAVGFFLPSERAALGRLGRRKAEVGA